MLPTIDARRHGCCRSGTLLAISPPVTYYSLPGALKCGKHEVDNGRTIPWAGTFYERAFS